jgi:hypothetical protein
MSRKTILYISFFLLINTSLLGQSGIYLVSLRHSISDASECKVIVTDPQGGSTLNNITHYGVNIEAHYSELNTIFNNIISTGYQLFGQLNDPYVDNWPTFSRRTTWVFKAP